MNQPKPSDPTADARGGYDSRRAVLRLVLIISIGMLGFAVWQAIQYSQRSPQVQAPPPITSTTLPATNDTLDEQSRRLQQNLARSQEGLRQLQASTQDSARRTKAAAWWIGAVVLLFHIFNVIRLLKKLARAYAQGQENYAKHYQLKK